LIITTDNKNKLLVMINLGLIKLMQATR